eukprot:6758949-Prymnesium_polylepis.1
MEARRDADQFADRVFFTRCPTYRPFPVTYSHRDRYVGRGGLEVGRSVGPRRPKNFAALRAAEGRSVGPTR